MLGSLHLRRMDKRERLRSASLRQQIAFLDAELDTALLFLELAEAELAMNNFGRVDELMGKAVDARNTAANFLADFDDQDQRDRLKEKYEALARSIGDIQRRSRPIS